MTLDETQNKKIDDLFKDVNLEPEPEITPEIKQNATNLTHALVGAFKGITNLYAEKTGYNSIALTDNDCEELEKALIPLGDEILKLVAVLPYLPLILFAVGYTMRVISEISQKRKEKKNMQMANPSVEDNKKYLKNWKV